MSQNRVSQDTERPVLVNDADRCQRKNVRYIVKAIRAAERKLRDRWWILDYQNTIGMLFLAACGSGFATHTVLYLLGSIPVWVCIVGNAICVAVLHELEHDLIHSLYFRGHAGLQKFLLLITWPFMGNSVNPLYRRKIHLLHHRTSGRVEDFEVRLTGTGLQLGFVRLLTVLDGGLASLFRRKEFEQIPSYNHRQFVLAGMPFVPGFVAIWYIFILFHATDFVAWLCGWTLFVPPWLASFMTVINTCAVVWVLPNFIRHACLFILTSMIHYYGDVQNTLEQIQVVTRWYLWPLQVFTVNLGSTHAIHHFVTTQPFYLRQLVAPAAHAAMRNYGVRFNDFDTLVRANRYHYPATGLLDASAGRYDLLSRSRGAGHVCGGLEGRHSFRKVE
jgi:fatty acid desaturase